MTDAIVSHQQALQHCQQCPDMIGPVITGNPVHSPVLLVGQAPGVHEGSAGKPFAWTAGKTLFKWFADIGLDEVRFRERVYMSAVCRCFPGKNPKGGDRVPSQKEINQCRNWLATEIRLLRPQLVIPVGKLAIRQFAEVQTLKDIVGQKQEIVWNDQRLDMIALPHPSGASTWHRTEPGKTLLLKALALIAEHPGWLSITR